MIPISVVIPLYNKENTICKCLDSILSQKYENLEIIVINDGSTDNSLLMIEKYENHYIRVFSQKNAGVSAARNFGVKKALNEWIVFLDADDELLPNSLTTFDNLISKTQQRYNVYACNFLINKNGITQTAAKFDVGVVNDNFKDFFKNKLPLRCGSYVIHKSVLLQHPHNVNLKRYEDLAVLLDIIRCEQIYKSPACVMVYHADDASASNKRGLIEEDFLGHLCFRKKSFWERAILYGLFEQAVILYPQAKKIYSHQLKCQIDVKVYFILIHAKQRIWKFLHVNN